MSRDKDRYVFGGMFFEVKDGRFSPVDPVPPDVVVARRLRDFEPEDMPAAARLVACAECGCAVVTEAKFPEKLRVCMQCAGIQPMPFPKADS
jgi:hypothetical protein